MKTGDRAKAEELFKEGNDLLEACDFEGALSIGKKLQKLSYSGAFEIIALSYEGLDKKQKAVTVLEEGVKKAPSIGRLWQLLGNLHSDLNQFTKAFDAYEKGLNTPTADVASLNYNYGLALLRANKIDLAEVKATFLIQYRGNNNLDPALSLLIDSLRMSLLNRQEKYLDCVAYSETLALREEECPKEVALIWEKKAYALWKIGSIDKSFFYLKKAIQLDKHNRDAQWLLRELNKEKDFKDAKYYRILVHGKWPRPFQGEKVAPNFYTSYDVVADNKQEAFEYIKIFEPKELHGSLEMEEAKVLKAKKQPKGVYQTSGYAFYQSRSKQ